MARFEQARCVVLPREHLLDALATDASHGLPNAMYSMTLFTVDLSFIALARSGFTHTSAVVSIASRSASGATPVKVDEPGDLEPLREQAQGCELGASADQAEVHAVPVHNG